MFIKRNRSLLSQYPIHNNQSIDQDNESSWGFFIEMEAIPAPSEIKLSNKKIKTNTFLFLSFEFPTIDCLSSKLDFSELNNDIDDFIDKFMVKLNYIVCRPTVDSLYYVV